MMIAPTAHGVDKNVDDLYGDQFSVALARAASTLECAPYWHSGEKAPTRLTRAIELVRLSRVQLQDDRLATVHGSTKPYDVTGFHCTCPQSQKGSTHWCVHSVAVKLARTLAEQAPRKAAPVTLGTLRPGTLPLPPVTVDERLAQPSDGVSQIEAQRMATEAQGDVMDDNEYIPEPDTDDAPTTVMAPTVTTPALRPLAPADDDLEQALQTWTVQRGLVRKFLAQELHANVDYYTLKIGGKESKPSLSKAGAEKVLGWLRWSASFAPDVGTWEMLGKPTDVVFYVCTLRTRSGEIVGEGRGARSLKKDGGDINKAIKMAEKSAMVSSVLRTGAMSDCFTQDLEDMQEEPVKAAPTKQTTSQDLRQRIWRMVQAQEPEARTREAVEAWIQQETGYTLHPDHYTHIIGSLEARA
jgi:hypothetical protein